MKNDGPPLVERLRYTGNRIVNYNFGKAVAELLFEAADALDGENYDHARWGLIEQALATPDLTSDLSRLSAIGAIVNSRQLLSAADIEHGQALAAKYGWERTVPRMEDAAQPMYEALRRAERVMTDADLDHEPPEDEARLTLEAVRAAIAKATGEHAEALR